MRRTNTLALGQDRALYTGELPATGMHRHAAPVLLLGLSGRFLLRFADGRSVSCHSALVDTDVEHIFDPQGERVALMYLEPDAPEARSLRHHLRAEGPVAIDPARRIGARHHCEARLASWDLAALLRGRVAAAAPVDARVAHSLALLRGGADGVPGRDAAAALARLSVSRFNHLFSAEMGVSFRRYRVWSQVRAAMQALGRDLHLTRAALDGGFADSAHFSRAFRQSFGMTPSSVLKPLIGVRVE